MLRICPNCGRLNPFRHCYECGEIEATPIQNRPEDRVRPVEKRAAVVEIRHTAVPRMRPVYRKGKPPVFKPDLRRAA